jgi:hypothetical protein
MVENFLALELWCLHIQNVWYLTLSKEHTLRMSENRVLRRVFGPEREIVAGENCIMMIIIIALFTNYYGDQIMEDEWVT